jgi:hypothetical protein
MRHLGRRQLGRKITFTDDPRYVGSLPLRRSK